MKLIRNSGTERVADELRQNLTPDTTLSVATPAFSLFAFGELQPLLARLAGVQLALPAVADLSELGLLGTAADRPLR
ncbi:MAG: hypothetical protein EOO60_03120, partial [Hymenobacter sp.]